MKPSANAPPCPTCKKPMGRMAKRNMASLAPRIPAHFGTHRRTALEDSQDGWCAMCDELPIKHPRGTKVYTCGRKPCMAAWRNLCTLDWRERNPEKYRAQVKRQAEALKKARAA